MVTEAAFRIFRSPVSTPVTISNLGIDLGVMAKLKPFSHRRGKWVAGRG